MTPLALIADESLDQLHRSTDWRSPECSWTYPDNDVVAQPKRYSDMAKPNPQVPIISDDMLQEQKLSGHGTANVPNEVEIGATYLLSRVHLHAAYGRSVLLHELVRHIRCQADLDAIACGQTLVAGGACSVQAECLKQHVFPKGNKTLTAIRGMGIVHKSLGERCLMELNMNGG